MNILENALKRSTDLQLQMVRRLGDHSSTATRTARELLEIFSRKFDRMPNLQSHRITSKGAICEQVQSKKEWEESLILGKFAAHLRG
jgi:hypothetical protein